MLLAACSTPSASLKGQSLTIKNTIQSTKFTQGVEKEYGTTTTKVLDSSATAFDDSETKFVYDITVSDDTITMNWVSNENNDKLARVIEADTFDRYYLTFSDAVIASASADSGAKLKPTVTVQEDGKKLLIVVGEGMKVGPGFNATINLTLK